MQICAWIWFLHTSYSFSDFIWNICLIFCIMLSVILPSWVMLFPTCFGFRLSYIFITSPDSLSSEIDPGVNLTKSPQGKNHLMIAVPFLDYWSKRWKSVVAVRHRVNGNRLFMFLLVKNSPNPDGEFLMMRRECAVSILKKSIIKHTCSFRSSSSALLKKPCFAI